MIALPPPPPVPPPARAVVSLATATRPVGAHAGGVVPPRILALGDPYLGRQWHLPAIRWTPPTGTRTPMVAVLDTGVDVTNPDLLGVVDRVRSRSFVGGSALVDRAGHGTHVAGLIAAVGRNGVGGAGVARARIVSIKVADDFGDSDATATVRGINYAISQRVRVISLCLSGPDQSAAERAAIARAIRAGIVVVAATGNSARAGNPIEYPAGYRHVIAVGALATPGSVWPDSTSGPQVFVAAPGKTILSTGLRRRSSVRSGTSMAAAIVAGAAARLVAQRPGIRPDQVAEVLRATATDVAPAGRDDATGAGRIDLTAALARRTPPGDRLAEPDDDPALVRANALLVPANRRAGAAGATLRAWFDPADTYGVHLAAGQTIAIRAEGASGLDPDLIVWKPGTPAYTPGPVYVRDWSAAIAIGPGAIETLRFTASFSGTYYVQVRVSRGGGVYGLSVVRSD